MSILNIGILGCGAAAKRYYLPVLKNYCHLIDNLYFIDKNITLAHQLAEEVGRGKCYDDYKKILDKVQGVVVILPNSLHYPVSTEFLNLGVHVLCEKPLAQSSEEVKKMIDTAEKNNVGL